MHHLRTLQSLARTVAPLTFVVLIVAAPVAAQQQPIGLPAGDPAGTNWTTYGGNLFNQRYSSLKQITTSNVANLKGAWTYHIQGGTPAASFESSPIVVGGV